MRRHLAQASTLIGRVARGDIDGITDRELGYQRRDIAQILGEQETTYPWRASQQLPKLRQMRAAEGISDELAAYLDQEVPQMAELAGKYDHAVAATSPPPVRFRAADCALFQRYTNRVAWPAGVEPDDRTHFKDIRSSLVDLFGWLAAGHPGTTKLAHYESRVNPNAISPPDLWGCAYPAAAGHQSFALQVALIIRADGAELCFCLGAGSAQLSAEKLARLQSSFAELRERLPELPDSIIGAVSLGPEYRFRKRWRSEAGASEFSDLRDWLSYAASPEGAGASVSRYFDPDEVDALGTGIAQEMYSLLIAVAPLIDFVYGEAPPPIDPLEAALAKFEETVDEALLDKYRKGWEAAKAVFESTFGTEDSLSELTAERFFTFLNQVDSHTNAETGLFRLGPGTPAPKRANAESWRALEEDLPKLKSALKTLLFGTGNLGMRVDEMLALQRPRRYITDDLAVPSMLMCFVDEANHSGMNRMHVKEDILKRVGKLPALPAVPFRRARAQRVTARRTPTTMASSQRAVDAGTRRLGGPTQREAWRGLPRQAAPDRAQLLHA
jgi:hypothetical protein